MLTREGGDRATLAQPMRDPCPLAPARPLAVLDIDVLDLPDDLPELARCGQGLALLRLGGRPCGQALIAAGAPESLRDRILEAADSSFWEAWLKHRLEITPIEPGPVELPSATVAICTRNRTDDLRRCLQAILDMPEHGQEILVIDNAPSDDSTRRLVQDLPRIRYVREDRAGLDVARNRALRESRSEIVAFTDDDAVPDRLWLSKLRQNFSDPLVMASTGLTMALELETEAQIAFQRYGGFTRGFKRILHDAARQDPLLAWHAGAGVNMAIRRSAMEAVGPFDEALDAGTRTLAGGDSDMFRRILTAGYRIVYDPEALIWHRHRRSLTELHRQLFGYEVAAFAVLTKALLFEGNLGTLIYALRWSRRQVRAVVRSALRRPGAPPLAVPVAHIRGGLAGPWRYIQARRQAHHGN